MGGWIAGLNSLVVTSRNDRAVGIDQHRADGYATLIPGFLSLLDGCIKPRSPLWRGRRHEPVSTDA